MDIRVYQKLQARLIKVMRTGAQYFLLNQISHEECADLMAEVETVKAEAGYPSPNTENPEAFKENRKKTSKEMILNGLSHEAIGKALVDDLMLDLDYGEVRLAASNRVIDYKKSLHERAAAGLEILRDEIQYSIQVDTDLEAMLAEIQKGTRYQNEKSLVEGLIKSTDLRSDVERVMVDPICVRLAAACKMLVSQRQDGHDLPKQLLEHQAVLQRNLPYEDLM